MLQLYPSAREKSRLVQDKYILGSKHVFQGQTGAEAELRRR